jgi:hypothetical protein
MFLLKKDKKIMGFFAQRPEKSQQQRLTANLFSLF